jgi:Flp pilus assembly protein TadD
MASTLSRNCTAALLAVGAALLGAGWYTFVVREHGTAQALAPAAGPVERQGSESAYRDVLASRPDDLPARGNLAELLRTQGRVEEALEQFRILAKQVPDDGEVQLRTGVLMLSTRRYGEAEEQLSKTFALLPEDARVHNNYGVALISQGKAEPAIRAFETAVRLNPTNEGYRSNLEAARAMPSKAAEPSPSAEAAPVAPQTKSRAQ